MLTPDDFVPLLQQDFHFGGDAPTLTLIAIERGNPDGVRRPFTLILRGSRDRILPEGQYGFALPGSRHVSLYVIPVHTPAPTHQDYQIVFN